MEDNYVWEDWIHSKKIDGDYVYLENVSDTDKEEKCVARALLPAEISEGTELVYEMLEYSIK